MTLEEYLARLPKTTSFPLAYTVYWNHNVPMWCSSIENRKMLPWKKSNITFQEITTNEFDELVKMNQCLSKIYKLQKDFENDD